jgi:carbon-monoxide dehydrogenase medium subunit
VWDLKEYRFASSPNEAVALLRQGPGRGVYIAGGTDLRRDAPPCDYVVDINHAGIDTIDAHADGDLFLGAAVTLPAAARSGAVAGFAGGALAAALAACAQVAARPTATVGGYVCHAARCGDLAPVLLVLDADCVVADETEVASLPLGTLYRHSGGTTLRDKLLVGVVLPRAARLRRCLAHRDHHGASGEAIAQVVVGLDVVENRIVNLRIGLGAVTAAPHRAFLAEAVLTGQDPRAVSPSRVQECAETAAAEFTPLDDDHASADYRRDKVAILTRRLLARLLAWQETPVREGPA